MLGTTIIDRQLIRGYFKGYLVCLVSLLSLYVVVDLFTNLDDFSHHSGGFRETVRLIVIYYGLKMAQIFDRLAEPIVLAAAMFTVALMQRNNEQLPLLSAGVSTRRIVFPVICVAILMTGVTVANQELLIPTIGDRLMNQKDDPEGEREIQARGGYEPNGIHLVGMKGNRRNLLIKEFHCTIPQNLAGQLVHLSAAEAVYVPPRQEPRSGGWEMRGVKTSPPDYEVGDLDFLEKIDDGKYFLKTRRIDFEALTRHHKWYLLASTTQLYRELQRSDVAPDQVKAVLFHMRITRPILGVLLVVLGLSTILKDQNRNVILSAGLCIVLCAVFFLTSYLCRMLGEYNYLPPAFAAWCPVLFFGPMAVFKLATVHT